MRALSSVGRATPLHGEGRGSESLSAHMKKQITCIVSGRVQGVFYRAFTQANARSLGINGEVKNLSDGTVEIVAEGEEGALNQFKSILWRGSKFSKVNNVICEYSDKSVDYNDFKIKYKSFFDRF